MMNTYDDDDDYDDDGDDDDDDDDYDDDDDDDDDDENGWWCKHPPLPLIERLNFKSWGFNQQTQLVREPPRLQKQWLRLIKTGTSQRAG